MKLLFLTLLALPCFGAYGRVLTFTIDHTQVAVDRPNYTVLLRVTNAELGNGGSGLLTSSLGYDLICSANDSGTAPLPFFREKWVSGTGETLIWCKTSASSSVDTPVYLVYQNAAITADQATPLTTFRASIKDRYALSDVAGTTISGTDTIGNYTLTNNGATIITGKINGGAAFSGTAQYMNSAGGTMVPTMPLTIEAWLRPTNATSNAAAATSVCSGGTNVWNGFYIQHFAGDFYATKASASTFQNSGLVAGSINNWHHVAAVFASATSSTIYVDGVAGTTTTASFTPAVTPTCHTVGGFNLTGTVTSTWKGEIDEMRYYSEALTASEIANNFNSQKTSPTFYTITGPANAGTASSRRRQVVVIH